MLIGCIANVHMWALQDHYRYWRSMIINEATDSQSDQLVTSGCENLKNNKGYIMCIWYCHMKKRLEHWKNVFTQSITARFPTRRSGALLQRMYTWYEREGLRCPCSKISQASMMPSALAVKYTLGLHQRMVIEEGQMCAYSPLSCTWNVPECWMLPQHKSKSIKEATCTFKISWLHEPLTSLALSLTSRVSKASLACMV